MRKRITKGIMALTLATVMAASVFPAIPASAKTVMVSDTSGYGALPSAPSIALKETIVSGQSSTQWTFAYAPVIGDVKYKTPAYVDYDYDYEYDSNEKRYVYSVKEVQIPEGTTEESYSPTMKVLVFSKEDTKHEKPEIGSTAKETYSDKYCVDSGKTYYYVDPEKNPNYKYEFTISANDLTPGDKVVIGYYFDNIGYEIASKNAYYADRKLWAEAYVAYRNQQEIEYRAAYAAWEAAGKQGDAPESDTSKAPDIKDFTANRRMVSVSDYDVASAPVNIKVESEAYASTFVTSNSVKFSFTSSSAVTGYELYRKSGKNFVKIASVSSSTYTDKDLVSKTTYTYRVKPYFINPTTKVKSYGKYNEIQATTKGSALKLHATVTNKNKIKLSWNKVNNALGYEIYRSDTYSNEDVVSNGESNSFGSYRKIKTLKKSKKAWIDKSVKGNISYNYIVKAILPKGKIKGDSSLEIMESASASLRFGRLSFETTKINARGDKTVTWERMYGAKGYKIERYDYNMTTKEWDWVPIATLGKNSTKYTFKAEAYTYFKDEAAQAANDPVYATTRKYRITPFKSESVLGTSTEVSTSYSAGIAKKVSAKVDKAAGGIRITWEKVPNASYYRVYRVMSDVHTNNKDVGGYTSFSNATAVTEYVGAKAPVKVDVAAYNAEVDRSIDAYKATFRAESKAYYKAYDEMREAFRVARKDYDDGKTNEAPKLGDYAVKPSDYFKTSEDDYCDKYDKLDTDYEYYYQNYSYKRSYFDANTTSIVDYYGSEIYEGNSYVTMDYTYVLQDKLKSSVTANDTPKSYQNIYSDYSSWVKESKNTLGPDGRVNVAFKTAGDPFTNAQSVIKLGEKGRPQAGVSYDYYVVAYMGTARAASEYSGGTYGYTTKTVDGVKTKEPYKVSYSGATNEAPTAPISDDSIIKGQTYEASYNTAVTGAQVDPATGKRSSVVYAVPVTVYTSDDFKWTTSTEGVKKYGRACYTEKKAAKKPALKSVKTSKGKVTIAVKKKVAGADYYKIYRATKKKGKYISVGETSSAKTLKFVDKSAIKGKTYYYKVVSVVKNEANGELESAATAVKKVKAK